jgi:hypothetical protein
LRRVWDSWTQPFEAAPDRFMRLRELPVAIFIAEAEIQLESGILIAPLNWLGADNNTPPPRTPSDFPKITEHNCG